MSLVVAPPAVSTPMGKEVTSDSNKSCAVKDLHLLDASCTAAIYSTASSGSMGLCSLPLKTLNHGLYSWDSGRVSHKHQAMHIILLMSLSRRHSTRGPWNCGVVHAKLDGLGHHAASIFKPLDKGVASNSSKSCEDCALPCNTILNCFIRLMDLFGSLSLESSWILDCNLGFRSSLSQAPGYARSSAR